ncbi:hypothetical protein [Leptolyngbya sp. 7M]|uniref:hypothetical protein n=1 Tax=Leptolyngbya sp. 7M TaxID=2812896 RepID=UPI001B8C9132|nr:hypothetical protein [Leptolyngbya sp. 7M]QYO65094.1 hypothetical protein JVX88_37260 [Leptolyngbya sp. 7M]
MPEKDELYGGVGADVFRIESNYFAGINDPSSSRDQAYAIVKDFNLAEGDRVGLLPLSPSNSYIIEQGDFNGDGIANDTFIIQNRYTVVNDHVLFVNNLVAVIENTNAATLLAAGAIQVFD